MISVFSGDIRQFVKIQPQRLNIWILKARLNSAVINYRRIEEVYQSTREFLLELLWRVAVIVMSFLFIALYCSQFIISHVLDKPLSTSERRTALLSIILGTVVIALAVTSSFWLWLKLRFYATYKMRLEKKITRLGFAIEKRDKSS